MCVPKPWERMWKHQHESMYSFSNKGGIQFGPFLEKGICEDMHKCEAKLAPVRLFQLTLESLKRDGPHYMESILENFAISKNVSMHAHFKTLSTLFAFCFC